MTQEIQENFIIDENFAELFGEYKKESQKLVEGTIVKAVIIEITDKNVVVDVGAKSVGYLPKNEFQEDVEEGDVIDLYLEKIEDRNHRLLKQVLWMEWREKHGLPRNSPPSVDNKNVDVASSNDETCRNALVRRRLMLRKYTKFIDGLSEINF